MPYINGNDSFAIQGFIKGDSVYVRFSAFADGTCFTENWNEGQEYIGFASGVTAPTDKSAYNWQKIIYKPDLTIEEADKRYAKITDLGGSSAGYFWSETYNPNKIVLGFEISSFSIYDRDSDNNIEYPEFRGVRVYNFYGDYKAWQPFKVGNYSCEIDINQIYINNPFDEYGQLYGSITINDAWLNEQEQTVIISRWLQ